MGRATKYRPGKRGRGLARKPKVSGGATNVIGKHNKKRHVQGRLK